MSQDRTHPAWLHTTERCYWSILHEPCQPRLSTRDRIRLGFAFEDELPMPLEGIVTAYAPIDGQRTLACGVDRTEVDEALSSGALALRPSQPPAFVTVEFADGNWPRASLDFLTGPTAARPMRRSRLRVSIEIAAVIALVTSLVLLGMQRRIDLLGGQTQDLDLARQALIESALPDAKIADEFTLLSELRRLERSRAPGAMPAELAARQDITPALAQALQSWPRNLHARTRHLAATSDQLQIQTEVDDIEQSEQLAQALAASERWNAGVPRVESQGRGGFLATITLETTPGGTP